jgi:NAD(P)-dependent dehydrogenase (short-subunit alcohol dehydrogenase family)
MTKPVFDDDDFRTRLEARHPFRGLGQVEDIAKAAVFFASEDAQWVTGVGLPVDGGYYAS